MLSRLQNARRQLAGGRRAEAMLAYEEVSANADEAAPLNVELGHLALELGYAARAVAHFRTASDAEPENAHYLGFLGVALQRAGSDDEAVDAFERALGLDASIAAVNHGLGIVYMERADYTRARFYLEQAHSLLPADTSIMTNLATTLARLDEHDKALKFAEKALRKDSSSRNAHYAVATILSELGRTEDAIRQLQTTVRQHKTFGAAWDLLARMKRYTTADKDFVRGAEKVLEQGLPALDRIGVHYALGKVYDDCGDWERAFENFAQANLLQKRDYDVAAMRKLFAKLRRQFNSKTLASVERGNPSRTPVFIVGMPRSGTTLMERMIASHPEGAGAGELPEMPRIAEQVGGKRLDAELAASCAEDYLNVLTQQRANAARIVDKLPGNFLHVGLIATLFPNATIIHSVRNPLDTCLSCYFQNFTNVPWANDLDIIAEVYLFYRDVMDWWNKVLPEGRIVEIRYEDLVADPEIHGSRLLEACGVEWDPDSLDFYRKEKVEKTASLWQVRQPIYRSSVRRWRNYTSHLGPLAGKLGDYLESERDELAAAGIDVRAPSRIVRMARRYFPR